MELETNKKCAQQESGHLTGFSVGLGQNRGTLLLAFTFGYSVEPRART